MRFQALNISVFASQRSTFWFYARDVRVCEEISKDQVVAENDLLYNFRAHKYVADLLKSLENYIAVNHMDLSVEPYSP